MAEPKKSHLSHRQRSIILGLSFGLALGALLVYGFATTQNQQSEHLVLALLLPTIAGLLLALLHARRALIGFYCVAAGVILGAEQAFELFLTQYFDRQFIIGVITLVFFATFGLVIGGLAEFVGFLHKLGHRGKMKR